MGHTRHTKKDVSDIQREGNYIGYTGSEVGMEHNMFKYGWATEIS